MTCLIRAVRAERGIKKKLELIRQLLDLCDNQIVWVTDIGKPLVCFLFFFGGEEKKDLVNKVTQKARYSLSVGYSNLNHF